jgi:uncharacterized protein (DUF302 family)
MNPEPVTRTYLVTQIESTLDVPYTDFTTAFESLLGIMPAQMLGDLPALSALSPDAARKNLASVVGPLDFVLFQRLDHGAVVRALHQRDVHAITYVFGNALIAVEMTKDVMRAGLHVPLRLMVEEIAEGRVRVTYDLPSSLIAPLGSPAVNAIARDLDVKVERLLQATSVRARVH